MLEKKAVKTPLHSEMFENALSINLEQVGDSKKLHV